MARTDNTSPYLVAHADDMSMFRPQHTCPLPPRGHECDLPERPVPTRNHHRNATQCRWVESDKGTATTTHHTEKPWAIGLPKKRRQLRRRDRHDARSALHAATRGDEDIETPLPGKRRARHEGWKDH